MFHFSAKVIQKARLRFPIMKFSTAAFDQVYHLKMRYCHFRRINKLVIAH